MIWHLVGGEYPPNCGGVGDYTEQLASALSAAGDAVHVWIPGAESADAPPATVHPLPDAFGSGSRAVLEKGWTANPGVVLLQYAPNAFGMRGMNLPFCRWLVSRRRAGVDVRVMFHEPYFYFSIHRPWRNALAVLQRRMAAALIRASSHVYFSSETWRRYLEPYGATADALAMPIPSTIPAAPRTPTVTDARRRFGASGAVVGHFGTFGDHIAHDLLPAMLKLLRTDSNLTVALIGERGDQFHRALTDRARDAAARCIATGRLPAEGIAASLRACDVLLQPYPDGVTTRRTTIMAGLRNEVAIVTTEGALTEPLWRQSGAAALAPAGDVDAITAGVCGLLVDPDRRLRQACRGAEVYHQLFSIEHTVAALRESGVAAVAQ